MPNILAIDAGGSSTRAAVLDAHGTCVGYGTAGGGNPISAGAEAAATALSEAVAQALETGSTGAEEIEHVVVAMAGARTHLPADHVDNHAISDGLGRSGVRATFAVESDLHAMYASGTYEPDGYALVAGTGAAAIRVRSGRVEKVADGMGWLLGDAGSGFWLGREVVRAVVAALDGRGPDTALTTRLLDRLEVAPEADDDGPRPASLRRLVDLLYAMRPVRLAQFAPLAFADPDDEVAAGIVSAGAEALAESLAAVRAHDLGGPLVLGGGVLLGQPVLRDAVQDRWVGDAPPSHLVSDGAVGAAILALRRGGTPVRAQVFDRVTDSLARLR